nr:hypothetical protein MACL_00003503 [Theileria orientalis]
MTSLCCKNVKDLKDLIKATHERIERSKVLTKVNEPLKDLLKSVKDVETKRESTKRLVKEDREIGEKSPYEAPIKRRKTKENQKK